LEIDPLSPPKGEAAPGEHPLNLLFFRDYFNGIRSYPNRGMPSGGSKSMKNRSPEDRLFVPMRSSIKPILQVFIKQRLLKIFCRVSLQEFSLSKGKKDQQSCDDVPRH
jgi:hypothetical protein